MIWLGYMCGRAMGWTPLESIFTGAILSISSTTIVAKAYQKPLSSERLRELVFGVLLAEDLTAVVELAILTTLASGASVSASLMTVTIARLILFLVAFVGIGFIVVPPVVRFVVRMGRPETTLVATVGSASPLRFSPSTRAIRSRSARSWRAHWSRNPARPSRSSIWLRRCATSSAPCSSSRSA